ncbi:MAG: hypothetical protein QUV12_08305 [Blastomonas fulva]|nr:hypothetical protein [Blastomonas fulva]
MSEELFPQLRVTARSRSFRRAGMAFGAEPVILALAGLTSQVLVALVKEAELVCEIGDGEAFQVVTLADLEDRLDIIAQFMTGQAEGADTNSPAPSPNASTASDATAVSGDDAPKTETGSVDAGAPEGPQPTADSAPAPVAAPAFPAADIGASPATGKPSGRAPRAAKPKASEAKAAS